MSVSGEFRRSLGDCLEFLDGAAASGAEPWAAQLHEARARAAENLSDGAALVLDTEASDGMIRQMVFRTEIDEKRFETLHEHLVAICRVVLGQ